MGKVKKVVVDKKRIDKNLVKPIKKYKVDLKNARKPSKVKAEIDLKSNKVTATSDDLSFLDFVENFEEPVEDILPASNEIQSNETETSKAKKPAENDNKNLDSLPGFDEDTVRSGVKALFNLIEKNKNEKGLFDDEEAIFLQFSSIKIGKTPSRILRISLKHSLLKDSGEICLIIPDTKGKSPKEYEKTIEKCEELLKKENVNNIKTIMTYYQLRTDYGEYELQRKLVELYDIFLVDGRIASYVGKKLGKIFRTKRKAPLSIRLDAKNLDGQIKFALLKTSTNLHGKGDNFVIQIGHSDMTQEQIYENILEVCTDLNKSFPGGWNNVRGLNLKTAKSTSLPIYYTLKNKKNVSVPKVKAIRPNAFTPVSGELSTVYDRTVTVLPSGSVKVHSEKGSEQNKRKIKEISNTEEIQSKTEESAEIKKRKRTKPVTEEGEEEDLINNKNSKQLKEDNSKLKKTKKASNSERNSKKNKRKISKNKDIDNLKTKEESTIEEIQNKTGELKKKKSKKAQPVIKNGEDEDMANNKDSKQSKVDKTILKKVKKMKENKKLKGQKLAQKNTKIVENGKDETLESKSKKQLKRKQLENGIKKSKRIELEPVGLEQLLTKNLDSIFRKTKTPINIKKNSKKRIVKKVTK